MSVSVASGDPEGSTLTYFTPAHFPPHQSFRTFRVICCGLNLSTVNGPVVTGFGFVQVERSCLDHTCSGTMKLPVHEYGPNDVRDGLSNVNTTVWLSGVCSD